MHTEAVHSVGTTCCVRLADEFLLWSLLLLSLVWILSCGLRHSLAAAVVVVCGVPRFSRSVGTLASLLCRRLTGTDTFGKIHSCGLC
jgi:hypothetical protein